jgi:uncharacterized protein (DUF433 family)
MSESLIQSDPSIVMGKPVVAGTRITVELILEKLAAGETIDEILDAHPRLTREGVLAALNFAANIVGAGPITEKKAGSKYDLAELVARIPKRYKAKEVGFGPPVGKEEW